MPNEWCIDVVYDEWCMMSGVLMSGVLMSGVLMSGV